MVEVVNLVNQGRIVTMVQSHHLVHLEVRLVIMMDHMVDRAQEALVMEVDLTLIIVNQTRAIKEDNKCLEVHKTRVIKAVGKVLASNHRVMDSLQVSSTNWMRRDKKKLSTSLSTSKLLRMYNNSLLLSFQIA